MIVQLCLALITKLAGTAAWHGDDTDASVAVTVLCAGTWSVAAQSVGWCVWTFGLVAPMVNPNHVLGACRVKILFIYMIWTGGISTMQFFELMHIERIARWRRRFQYEKMTALLKQCLFYRIVKQNLVSWTTNRTLFLFGSISASFWNFIISLASMYFERERAHI